MSLNERYEAAQKELASLQSSVNAALKTKKDATLATTPKTTLAPIRAPPATKARRTLKGHFGKITALHWAGDSTAVVSASQDGNLLLWNAVTANKLQSVSLRSSYVMSVGLEQSKGELVACGGLDNLCTVYRWGSSSAPPTAPQEMASHDGFVSCCRFISPQSILTSSGDSTCIRWDVPKGLVVSTYQEHKADAMFLALRPQDPSVFVSCSVDRTIKVWDIRSPSKSSVKTFVGHNGDINAVDFMPSDNNVFASCSEDGTVRVWDLRSYQEVAKLGNYTSPNGTMTNNTAGGGGPGGGGPGGEPGGGAIPINRPNDFDDSSSEGFTSISFSRSGRLLFCGHSDSNVVAFDTLSSTSSPSFVLQQAHDAHVSCIGVSPDGSALCTGSWDQQLKIWA